MSHSFQKKAYFLGTFFLFSSILFLFTYTLAHGATEKFSPLVGLPGITDSETATLPQYINAVYLVLIGLGSLIAVVRIAWTGIKYSLSESVLHKVDAKHDIIGVFIGLGVLLIPFIVLNTINPNLTNLDVLKLAPKVQLAPSIKGGAASTTPVTPSSSSLSISAQTEQCTNNKGKWTGSTCDMSGVWTGVDSACYSKNDLTSMGGRNTVLSEWNVKCKNAGNTGATIRVAGCPSGSGYTFSCFK